MKKMIQSFISILMAVSVFNQSVIIKAEESPPDSGTASEVYVNPLYPDAQISAAGITEDTEPAEDGYLESAEAAGVAVREGMRDRLASITVRLQSESSDYSDILNRIRTVALEHTGKGKEGDYIAFQYSSISTSINYHVEDGIYVYTFTFHPVYYTNAEQEEAVDAKAAEVLEQLDLDGMSDYRKIKTIYDYITDNVTYDYVNLDDDSYVLKYTAYAALINGTSVCQGYANLFYRLILDAGLDARIVSGTSQGENHAWNIVKLGDVYYNLDATWDAGNETYSYFLKGRNDFPDHIRNQEYLTESFETAYPMADTEYIVIPVTGLTVSPESESLHKGESTAITATVEPENASDPTVTFVSDNPEIVSVDEEGTITANELGNAVITVTTVDGGYTATSQITVISAPVEEIILDPIEAELEVGATLPITAVVKPEYAEDKTLSWSSFDDSVATVQDGLVTAVSPGQTIITAKSSNNITASAFITVKNKAVLPEAITVSPSTLEMTEGDTETLTATVLPEEADDKTVTWTSSDETVATVEDGTVTAVKEGTAVITAETFNGLKAECTVTVEKKAIEPEYITLDKEEITLTEGESDVITATVLPEEAEDKTVTWSSSDETVATVENGTVTAVKEGTAVITAETTNGLKAECTVTVEKKAIEPESITLDKEEITLTEGETDVITATVLPEEAVDKTVTWTSSDETVATVENGTVTAVKEGTAVITAETTNGLKAECTVTVEKKAIEPESITLDKKEITLTEGETDVITATVLPEEAEDKTVTWTSSNETVATVEDGTVTAVKEGTAVITAETFNGLKAECTVTVEKKVIEPESITLDKEEITLTEGEADVITATVLPEEADDKTVTWTSSDETVATVEDGTVTAVKEGTAVITAETANGLKAECTVTVEKKSIEPESITLNRTSLILTEGNSALLTATVKPSNADDKTVTWTSSDESVATVENGTVIAVKAGTAVITAETVNGLKAECTVTVEKKIISPESIALDKEEITLTEGETDIITATVLPEEADDKTVIWSSSDETVATVEDGTVTAVKAGTAIITAETVNGWKAVCTVTVEKKVIYPESITLNRTSLTLKEGNTAVLTAFVRPSDADDRSVIWSTDDETVATVANGIVTGVRAGTCTITAQTVNGLKAECLVTVEKKIIEAQSITLDPTEITLTEGDQYTLHASILPADTTDQTILWSSDHPEIAAVENGVITAVSEGSAVITASTVNGLQASCTVTVLKKTIEVTGIRLSRTRISMEEGTQTTIYAMITPSDATDRTVTWTSDNLDVVQVNNGLLTAMNPGTAVITAETVNGLQASAYITVTETPYTIAFSQSEYEVEKDKPFALSVVYTPAHVSDKELVWSSDKPEIISVEDGIVTALKYGQAVITVKAPNGSSASCTVKAPTPADACREFGWCRYNGKDYWYENWTRQAVVGDPKNIWDEIYGLERGREIYDPESDGWYWLDCIYDGAKAVAKEVWMPYIYQDDLLTGANPEGKWVRYNSNGKMIKGWYFVTGAEAQIYPEQAGNTYYYDWMTGEMYKGYKTILGRTYHFDEKTGVLKDN